MFAGLLSDPKVALTRKCVCVCVCVGGWVGVHRHESDRQEF